MKRYKLFLRNYLSIFFLLPFLVGCEKYLKGGEKILGTAIKVLLELTGRSNIYHFLYPRNIICK